MKLAGDRREVADIEGEGVVAAIPADDVEWVVVVDIFVDEVASLDTDGEIALDVPGHGQFGKAEVAFAVGRVFEELALGFGDVARGWADVTAIGCFDEEELTKGHVGEGGAAIERLAFGAELDGVGAGVPEDCEDNAFGNDEVIMRAKADGAHHGVTDARAKVDEEALVALRVFEVIEHLLGGVADGHFTIGVAEENDAAGD